MSGMDVARLFQGPAGWVQAAMEKYLGTYLKQKLIGRLNKSSGELEFGPLELRPEAFAHSDNVIEVKAAHIGRLRLQLPKLIELGGAPVTVHLESVYLLVGLPRHEQEALSEEQREREAGEKRERQASHALHLPPPKMPLSDACTTCHTLTHNSL